MGSGGRMQKWLAARARHLTDQAGQSLFVLVEIGAGLRSFVFSLARVLQAPDALLACARRTPVVLAFVVLNSLGLWAVGLPLHWAGLLDYEWRDAVRASSFFALMWLRLLLPEVSSNVFFAVLRKRDEKLAVHIKGMPSIYSKRARVRFLVLVLLGCAVAVAVLAASAPVLLPLMGHLLALLVAAAGAFIATWWLVLLIGALVVGILLAFGTQAYALIAPFVQFWQFDPVLALMLVVCTALGAMKVASPGAMLRHAVVLYYSCTVLTSEFLAHYAKRLERRDWEHFQRRHCWRLLGFGLPIWVLVHQLPLAGVALLKVFHGAAGSLLVDLLQLDDNKRAP